jgi:hypothetical protein
MHLVAFAIYVLLFTISRPCCVLVLVYLGCGDSVLPPAQIGVHHRLHRIIDDVPPGGFISSCTDTCMANQSFSTSIPSWLAPSRRSSKAHTRTFQRDDMLRNQSYAAVSGEQLVNPSYVSSSPSLVHVQTSNLNTSSIQGQRNISGTNSNQTLALAPLVAAGI